MSGSYYERDGFAPGWVFILEPYSTVLDDPDWHPYLLLRESKPGEIAGVLAYGSGQETEKRNGALCHTVQPVIGGVNDNALSKPTHFYPIVLVRETHEKLPRPSMRMPRGGRLRPRAARIFSRDLQAIQALFYDALGIGSGRAGDPGANAGSWRGVVVPLSDEYEEDTGVRFALVLTPHAYSASKGYQLLVHIVAGDGMADGPGLVRVTGESWIQASLGSHAKEALLVVPALETVWHESHVWAASPREAVGVVSRSTLERIEEEVVAFLDMQRPGPAAR